MAEAFRRGDTLTHVRRMKVFNKFTTAPDGDVIPDGSTVYIGSAASAAMFGSMTRRPSRVGRMLEYGGTPAASRARDAVRGRCCRERRPPGRVRAGEHPGPRRFPRPVWARAGRSRSSARLVGRDCGRCGAGPVERAGQGGLTGEAWRLAGAAGGSVARAPVLPSDPTGSMICCAAAMSVSTRRSGGYSRRGSRRASIVGEPVRNPDRHCSPDRTGCCGQCQRHLRERPARRRPRPARPRSMDP